MPDVNVLSIDILVDSLTVNEETVRRRLCIVFFCPFIFIVSNVSDYRKNNKISRTIIESLDYRNVRCILKKLVLLKILYNWRQATQDLL